MVEVKQPTMKTNHTKDEHDCDQNIESNMCEAHCRVCGKKYEQSGVRGIEEFYSTECIPEEMKQALSFMRQWLNEDRKATPMVTARDLWHWLEKDYTHFQEQHEAKQRELLEEIEKREIVSYSSELYSTEYANGYNQALDDIKTIATKRGIKLE